MMMTYIGLRGSVRIGSVGHETHRVAITDRYLRPGRLDRIGSCARFTVPRFFLIQEIRYHQTGFDEGQLLGIMTHSRLFPWCR